tara:strand:- start:9368 stop:10231 length:864 start_codon:yes stop_codon:yes gene_type:complete
MVLHMTTDVEEYCGLALAPVAGTGYGALPEKLLALEQELSTKERRGAAPFNKQLLIFLLQEFSLSESPWKLPKCVALLYDAQLKRLQFTATNKPDSYFSFQNDPFRKDLAILLHRLIPFGAEFANPHSGIPRSLAIKGGPKQAIRFLRATAASRGTRPFLELHMHPEVKEAFHPAGWLECYEHLADFLQLNPSLRGVQSTSWFLDPKLVRVSPRLAYLREVPEKCGAYILFAGADREGKSGALATSPTRRRLYASGDYQPRLFTRIWPVAHILRRQWRQFQPPSGKD